MRIPARHPRRAVVAIGLAGLVATACNALVGLGDLEKVSCLDDCGVAAVDGGGEDATDVASSDAAPDASTPSDAAEVPDASGATDASPGRVDAGCASFGTYTFCDDFDTMPLGALWGRVDDSAGPLLLDTRMPVSAPRALLAQPLDTAPVGSNKRSSLSRTFPASQHIVVELDLWIERPDTVGELDLLNVDLKPLPAGYTTHLMALIAVGGGYAIERNLRTPSDSDFELETVSANFTVWRHVRFDVSYGTATPRALLEVNGAFAGQLALPAITTPGFEVSVGAPYVASQTSRWNVHVDNVVVRFP